MKTISWACHAAFSVCLLASAAPALAQAPSYPQRTVTLVVGYPPGGSTDMVARTVAQELAPRLGQPVIVENAGGAGGSIGAQKVARSAPDGYTLLLGANNEVAINALVRKSVHYTQKDFTPIGLVATQPLILVASEASGIKNTADLVRVAKSKPGRVTYGSSGVGTSLHVAGEMVKQQAGIFLTHIPYRGTGPLTTDLLGGSLDLGVYVLSSALPQIRSGKMVAIGTTEARRSPATPDIPALAETPALKGVDVNVWFMLLAPANLPEGVATRLKTALAETLKSAEFRKKLEAAGSVVQDTQPDLQAFLAKETAKYKTIVQFADIKDE
jgi:tripartite-type tricarboxylate transporter receptor subunit TctC